MRDRTYYRQMPDVYLIEEGVVSDNELCIALAERLEDAGALGEKVAEQEDTIDDMRLLISSLEDEISALMKQIEEGQPK